jgi:hypothetical protein
MVRASPCQQHTEGQKLVTAGSKSGEERGVRSEEECEIKTEGRGEGTITN